jgi:hypothetical protein
VADGVADAARDRAARLVDVAEAVGLVDDDEIPGDAGDLGGPCGGEMVRADDDPPLGLERVGPALAAETVVKGGLEDEGGEGELVLEFLLPLLAEGGREDQQDAAAALGPTLRDDDGGLDGFAEPDLVGEDDALREGERKAKRAASIWCGLRSTRALAIGRVSLSSESEGARKVSRCARYLLW